MSTQSSEDYGPRVWANDPTTVVESRAAYEKNKNRDSLLRFANALYSARRNRRLAAELVDLCDELIQAAKDQREIADYDETTIASFLDTSDVISTYLEWMSRQVRPGDDRFKIMLKLSAEIVMLGIDAATDWDQWMTDPQSECFLRLTFAQILTRVGKQDGALEQLSIVEHLADSVVVPEQCVRVYAKLGMLLIKNRRRVLGVRYGIKAMKVSGVQEDAKKNVRKKALVAVMLGFWPLKTRI